MVDERAAQRDGDGLDALSRRIKRAACRLVHFGRAGSVHLLCCRLCRGILDANGLCAPAVDGRMGCAQR